MLVTQDHALPVNRQAWNLKARRPWKRSDITDKMVVAAYADADRHNEPPGPELLDVCEEMRRRMAYRPEGGYRYAYDLLCAVLGCPEKVAYSAMERACDRGLIEYGVSLRTGWITDKGIALFQ